MPRILDHIDEPSDLKRLSPEELDRLAAEIRNELVCTVTETGGHLASNLGAVELTLALHLVFNSPEDKIVWDVGHQSYVHKLLTGRRQRFPTLRQYQGLSGFTCREESPHDAFGAGHAGTSVSAALGMAVARDLAGGKHHVVAVIGDGAMTAGMAFEALNQAGHLGTRLIVLLNDNEMSISPNVGALARAFNRIRLDPRYHRAKEEADHVLEKLPMGSRMRETMRRFKESFKGMIIPTMIWEELGFTYMGPVDGHNRNELVEALAQAKAYTAKPTLIHVLTKKGKGYNPAEQDCIAFHGMPPNGSHPSSAPTYTKVFGQTVLQLCKADPKVVAITAAMLEGTGLQEVAQEVSGRVFDVGICEQHAVTFAAGLATAGYKPIVTIYSTFLQRGYDQIIHDVAIQDLPVVFALDRAGIVGEDGKTHQGAFDVSYLRAVPNLVVMAPKDENELRHMLYTALQAGHPAAVRYPRGSGVGVPLDEELRALPIGKAEVVRRGHDLAIIALGSMVYPCLEAAARLQREAALDCWVVNARFAKPLDEELITELAKRCGRLVTVEENALAGGFGSAVLELLERRELRDVRINRIGLPDEFVEHGSPSLLRSRYGLDPGGICKAILADHAFLPLPALVAAR